MFIEMKLPKNRQSRLATDVWIMGEAISRYLKMSTARDGFEVAVRQYADQLSKDEKFTELLEAIRKETEESLTALPQVNKEARA